MVPYEARKHPNLIRHLIDFATDLGFKTTTLKEISDALPFIPDKEPELELRVDECTKPTVDLNDRRRRCGVLYTTAYEEGKAGFYLSKICTRGTENSVNIPSTSFIQKDFIDAFFRLTADIWNDLQNLYNGGTTEAPSCREPSLLGDTLGTGCSNPATWNVQSMPAPASPVDMHDVSS